MGIQAFPITPEAGKANGSPRSDRSGRRESVPFAFSRRQARRSHFGRGPTMPIGEPAKPLALVVDAKSVAGVLKSWADDYFADRVRMALSNVANMNGPTEAVRFAGPTGEASVPFDVVVVAIVDMITSGGVTVRVVPTPDGGKDMSP